MDKLSNRCIWHVCLPRTAQPRSLSPTCIVVLLRIRSILRTNCTQTFVNLFCLTFVKVNVWFIYNYYVFVYYYPEIIALVNTSNTCTLSLSISRACACRTVSAGKRFSACTCTYSDGGGLSLVPTVHQFPCTVPQEGLRLDL